MVFRLVAAEQGTFATASWFARRSLSKFPSFHTTLKSTPTSSRSSLNDELVNTTSATLPCARGSVPVRLPTQTSPRFAPSSPLSAMRKGLKSAPTIRLASGNTRNSARPHPIRGKSPPRPRTSGAIMRRCRTSSTRTSTRTIAGADNPAPLDEGEEGLSRIYPHSPPPVERVVGETPRTRTSYPAGGPARRKERDRRMPAPWKRCGYDMSDTMEKVRLWKV